MSLRSHLTKRNAVAVLVVGSVLLGTGFGYVVPSASDLGDAPADGVGTSSGQESLDGPNQVTTADGDDGRIDPNVDDDGPPADQNPAIPTDGLLAGDESTTGDDDDDIDETRDDGAELVFTGETNATVT